MSEEMRKATNWNGKYKDIPFEIQNFKVGGRDAWTFYLFFRENQFEKDFFDGIWIDGERMKPPSERHIIYHYENTILGNLDWHGGCTWYSKEGGHDGAKRVVKAGCDYSHLFDEHHVYSEHSIKNDVEACVESLLERVTPKRWCNYCGDYFVSTSDETRCVECENR